MLLETVICLLVVCVLVTLMTLTINHKPNPKVQQDQLITKVRTNLKQGIKLAFLSNRAVFIQYSKKQQLMTLKSGANVKYYLKFPTDYYLELPGNELVIKKGGYVAPKTITLKGPQGFNYSFRIQMAWGEIYEN
ncbi:hypothetical protein [Holzapfeliella sp. JNUCC 80]